MTENIQDLDVLDTKNFTTLNSNVKSDMIDYYDREHIHEIINTIENHEHRMLVTFMWMTGVRVTEALSIRKKDLNFTDHIITIKWLKNRKYNNRSIPMHPNLKQLLQMYCAKINLEDLVFPISRQRAWQIMQKYFDGHPHTLRHSFAVNWLKCEGNIVLLSKMLGHSDLKITMMYLRVVPQDQGKELIKIKF